MHFVYRFIGKELVCLPPAAGLLAANPGFTAVLPAPSDPAGNMGEGPGQFLSLGVDCPVNDPVCCLRVAKASISPKNILFTARDGMISNLDCRVPTFSVMQHAYKAQLNTWFPTGGI